MSSARYSCPISIKLEFSRQIFEKSSNIKFHENPSSVGGELFHADRQTDAMKLIVAFRNFANAPKTQGTETVLWAAYLKPLAYTTMPDGHDKTADNGWQIERDSRVQ
jgi:hypothetical protein